MRLNWRRWFDGLRGRARASGALESPRPGALIAGDILHVRGELGAGVSATAVVVLIGGEERARVAPQGLRYALDIDVSRLACRMALDVRAETTDGAEILVDALTVWRAAFRPDPPRYAVVAVKAAVEGGRLSGEVLSEAPIARLEIWTHGAPHEVALGADGRFEADDVEAGGHLWAVFADEALPDLHLGKLGSSADAERTRTKVACVNGRPAAERGFVRDAASELVEIEDGIGAPGKARRRAFQPMRSTIAAVGSSRRVALTFRDGRRSHPIVKRMAAAGDDWVLVLGETGGAETIPVDDLVTIEPAQAIAPAPSDTLRRHFNKLTAPRPTMKLDAALPRAGVALPVFALRPPPAEIDRVVLIRPGAHPTDDIYVSAPLAPLLAERGIPLVIVSLDDLDSAEPRAMTLSRNSVVIVSRSADEGWLDRLAFDGDPFVVYLMDDDPLTAVDTEGLYHRYRRRVIEIALSDFPILLRRCDRFLVSSPALARRYASAKTVLMEPPFIRPAPSLAHLDDLSTIRVAYHGTGIHAQDIEFLFDAIAEVLEAEPRMRFQLVSGQPVPARLRRLKTFELVKPMAWTDYVAFAAANPAHVSLAPMLDTPFNGAKSIIKFLDAASLGAAGLYSRIAPYDAFVSEGVDGILVENDPQAWGQALRRIVAEPAAVKRMALAAQETARRRASLMDAQAIWWDLLGLG